MESLVIALNAVIPFLIYITFGYFVRAVGLVDEAFMNRLNHMVFRAFFPILMFYNLYNREDGQAANPTLILTGVACILLLTLLLLLTVPRLVKENARRGVIIQAIYRSNFVLFAIPLTESIFGAEGTAMTAMMVTIIVPLYNVLAVFILEYYRGGKVKASELLKKVLTNPLIMGAIAGLLAVALDIRLPDCLEKPVSQFSGMTTPLALFVLGGTLRFSSMRANLRYILPCLTVKLVLIPLLVVAATVALGFEPLERFILLTMFVTPTAASSYPMARSMGGDGNLAGELVVTSTAASVVTIFLWIFLLGQFGLI